MPSMAVVPQSPLIFCPTSERPAVERVIKTLKYDLASKDISKRGNLSFQARLDKSFIALHILLRI